MKGLALAMATVAVLAGCGGSGSGGGSTQPAGSIKVTMTEFHYEPSTLTASHGTVVFWLVNAGTVSHDFVIRDSSNNRVSSSELISVGDQVAFKVDNLAAGTYSIFCDQQAHESSGMKGTLTVT